MGERVTTGSEPRRERIWRCPECGDESLSPVSHLHSGDIAEREPIEVQEVVEPGHDEQAEAALNRLDARIERANAVWQPDPRTVAAVVEALREGSGPEDRTIYVRDALDDAADFIENHPRFKPSAPGGTDGH